MARVGVEAAIKVKGLDEFRRNLKKLDSELPKALRLAMNEAAQVVVDVARPKIPLGPAKGGHARDSLKVFSSTQEVRVKAGGKKFSYYPWLDFGGTVGRGRTGRGGVTSAIGRSDFGTAGAVKRTFIPVGRYLYPAFMKSRDETLQALYSALLKVGKEAGIEIGGTP